MRQTLAETYLSALDSLDRNLFRGTKGEDVMNLQGFLFENGYYREGFITGYFGTLTKTAVMRFQKLNNISPVVEFVGPITREVISQY